MDPSARSQTAAPAGAARVGRVTFTPPSTMMAARYARFGSPEVLEVGPVPVPEPRAGEVLLRVRAAGVNPIDWKLREGKMPDAVHLPAIPGKDVAGVVVELGEGVEGWEVGQEVFATGAHGAYAQFTRVDARSLAPKPGHLDMAQAAAVPTPALTAWQGLFDQGHLQAGQTVLIQGATGGVGHFAVQFAKIAGARVIAVSGLAHLELAKELGADVAIAHEEAHFEGLTRDVDLVLDLVGLPDVQERSLKVLKAGGRLVSTVTPPAVDHLEQHQVQGGFFLMQPDGALLARIGQLLEEGKVRVEVAQVLSLAQAARAHEISQRGHTAGKIVLAID